METTSDPKRGLRGVGMGLGILLMVLVGILIAERSWQLFDTIDGDKPDNVISVSGEGKVKAVPDVAIITMGVITQGSNAQEVSSKAADQINKITEFVKANGVAKEDITTTQASVNPRYDWTTGQSKILGYESTQTVTVKVRGVDQSSETASKIMSGAVDNGANSVYGSQFTIDDPASLQQEARKKAIEDAKQKAEELAATAGIKLGKVVSIQEGGGGGYYPPIPYYATDAVGRGGAMAMPEKSAIAPSLEPGQQEIVQTVTLVFEVR